MSHGQLSVIVPALNEAAFIGRTLDRIKRALPRAGVIVVDGGSSDATVAIAERANATVISAPRGRGVQCDAGAQHTAAEWFLFLHADTLLPADAERIIGVFVAEPTHQIATFRLCFDDSRFLTAWARLVRFDSVFTRFGDQGVLVRRSFYETLGGFPPWPLFEDVALFQLARKRTRVYWLPGYVVTSARRFQARGLVRQRLLNAQLMLRYLAGASPHELAARYHRADEARNKSATAGNRQVARQSHSG